MRYTSFAKADAPPRTSSSSYSDGRSCARRSVAVSTTFTCTCCRPDRKNVVSSAPSACTNFSSVSARERRGEARVRQLVRFVTPLSVASADREILEHGLFDLGSYVLHELHPQAQQELPRVVTGGATTDEQVASARVHVLVEPAGRDRPAELLDVEREMNEPERLERLVKGARGHSGTRRERVAISRSSSRRRVSCSCPTSSSASRSAAGWQARVRSPIVLPCQ